MGIQPLTVAAVAAALLVVSVGLDLAFKQTVTLEAGAAGGTMQVIGESAGDEPYSRPMALGDPILVNGSEMISFRARLQNDYPWSVGESYTLTIDGCYEGARSLAIIDVNAPARGVGSGTADILASKLLGDTRFGPKGVEGLTYYVTLCEGNEVILAGTLPLTEVSR